MIFLIEHGIGSEHRFRILINYNEIEVGEFENIKNLFFCDLSYKIKKFRSF